VIVARDLVVRFGSVEALRLARLEVKDGDAFGVRGANGSGKTTLLRVLAGLLRPTEGTVQGVPPRGRTVLVHQRPYLFRGTAHDNVAYALRVHRRPSREAAELLDRVGAGSLAERPAKRMSGGERRRVAIARAIACRPELLLLDEPYAALDEAGARDLTAVLEAFPGTLVVAAPDLAGAPVTRTLTLGA